MQESIVFLVRVQCRRKESLRSLSHLLMSFLLTLVIDDCSKMNVAECKNSKKILVLVSAILFARVMLLVLTIVFTSIVSIREWTFPHNVMWVDLQQRRSRYIYVGRHNLLSAADRRRWRPQSTTKLKSSAKCAVVRPDNDWCTRHATLYSIPCQTGSQCNWRSACVMWWHHLMPVMSRAPAFCIDWSFRTSCL